LSGLEPGIFAVIFFCSTTVPPMQVMNLKKLNNLNLCLGYLHFIIILYYTRFYILLKVSKRENFSLAFFALSEPIWVCELGSGKKNRFFYKMIPDFEGLWFFAAY
jgi:hypothetical protein